jgi:hypothetical protein
LELAIHWVLQIFGGIEFDWKRRLALFSDESMRNGTTSKTRSIHIDTLYLNVLLAVCLNRCYDQN